MNTPGANNKANPILGGSHLKRVPITIQYKNKPETKVSGYALSHEILPNQVSFFAAQKFPVDEELIVFFTENGEQQSMNVILRNMHEQISSGRVMNALPTEDDPFPARKFYRCYTTINDAANTANDLKTSEENPTETPEVEQLSEIPVALVPGDEPKAA